MVECFTGLATTEEAELLTSWKMISLRKVGGLHFHGSQTWLVKPNFTGKPQQIWMVLM
jgi:hypothetical protein